MPRVVYDLRSVSRITASAVGVPGKRTFYIQAREGDRLITLLCEKEHVAALVMGVEQMLAELDEKRPEATPPAAIPEDSLKLEEPLDPIFRVGQLGLGYDESRDALVLVAYQQPESEDADPETLDAARIWASRAQMRALSRHGAEIITAGRPICPLCAEPMDASGHICPRKNGHKQLPLE